MRLFLLLWAALWLLWAAASFGFWLTCTKGGIALKNRDWNRWVKAASVRAVKTMAQTAVATIGTAAILSEVTWPAVLSASVLAGVLSILTSLAGLPEVEA